MQDLIDRAPQLLSGLGLTISVSLVSLVVALLMGLIGAAGKLSKNPILSSIAGLYTTVIRGVPELVLLLLLFYGVQILLNRITDALGLGMIDMNAFVTGVLVIGFIYGAYMTETFRGAWLAIPKGQIEAAISCGMSKPLYFRRVIWPQLMRLALPGLSNNWAVLIKATALISLIGLKDIVWWANSAGKSTHQPFTFMLAVLIVYLGLNELSNRGLKKLTLHFNRGAVAFAGNS